MKRCNRCKTVKPFEAFLVMKKSRSGFRGPCRTCRTAYQKTWHAKQIKARDRRAWAIEDAIEAALQAKLRAEPEPWQIPASDCAVQLTIISACWLSCVKIGGEAIRRMMDRLVDATYLPGGITTEERARLRTVVERYRVGSVALEMVERTLHAVDVARRV